MFSKQKGFTLIELLIVIAVIGILAGIMSVSYNSSQTRARDSKRIADAKAIEAALENYRAANGVYLPSTTATQVAGASTGGWETSGAAQPGTFLSALEPLFPDRIVPVDPINNTLTLTGNTYRYITYASGTNGCDVAKGAYYVFIVNHLDTVSGASPESPGFSCSGHNWQLDGDYVFGGFIND